MSSSNFASSFAPYVGPFLHEFREMNRNAEFHDLRGLPRMTHPMLHRLKHPQHQSLDLGSL